MKSGASLAAALLLNLAVVFATITGLTNSKNTILTPVPVRVALLSPPPATPPSPAAPAAAKSLPRPTPEKKRSKLKAPAAPKPHPRPRDEPAPAAKAGETPVETRPAISSLPASREPLPTPAQSALPVNTPVSISASYAASNTAPPYPRVSIMNEEEGTAMLEVLVQPDGTAGDVRIKASSGYPLLDKAAKATVRRWRFNPATINGKPIAQWYQVPIQFKLPDN